MKAISSRVSCADGPGTGERRLLRRKRSNRPMRASVGRVVHKLSGRGLFRRRRVPHAGGMSECDSLQTRPLYRHEYEALGALGFFDDERVELLDGQVVLAAEEGPAHGGVYRRLNRILIEAIPAEEGEVGVGNPLSLSNLSSPQPDFMVVPPSFTYTQVHPTTASL